MAEPTVSSSTTRFSRVVVPEASGPATAWEGAAVSLPPPQAERAAAHSAVVAHQRGGAKKRFKRIVRQGAMLISVKCGHARPLAKSHAGTGRNDGTWQPRCHARPSKGGGRPEALRPRLSYGCAGAQIVGKFNIFIKLCFIKYANFRCRNLHADPASDLVPQPCPGRAHPSASHPGASVGVADPP